ncbi:MAG: hypothetical protein ABIG40_00410 [Parcubacteria group bacterium]
MMKLLFVKKTAQNIKEGLEKLCFVFLVLFIFLLVIVSIWLLKITGRYEEINKPSLLRERKVVIQMNHPDGGNEWIFIYRNYWKPIYLIKPWLILNELPFALADRANFPKSSFLFHFLEMAFVSVDRVKKEELDKMTKEEAKKFIGRMMRLRTYSLGKCKRALKENIPIIGFFEGGRTRNATEFVYSTIKRKPLGKLNKSLGLIVKQNKANMEVAWIEFPGVSYYCLQDSGKFSIRRFCFWYIKTLFGKNGKIILRWGRLIKWDELEKLEGTYQEISDLAENHSLELADEV